MFRGSGAADGNRLTTYIVLSGSGLSSSAPMTLESGVLSNSPPSQYGTGRPPGAGDGAVVIGKLGGRLPLAATCSGVTCISRLSKRSSLPDTRFVAVRIRRGARSAGGRV